MTSEDYRKHILKDRKEVGGERKEEELGLVCKKINK